MVVHNDLVDQFVVGSRITEEELTEMQADVSEQLLCCIPPIPPRTVRVDAVPVQFPPTLQYAPRVLVLYECSRGSSVSRDALKQRSNYVIRFLFSLGLAIIPLDVAPGQEMRAELKAAHASLGSEEDWGPFNWDHLHTETYLIAAIDDPSCLESSKWEAALSSSLNRPRQRCYHAILEYRPAVAQTVELPRLYVLEVSVDIHRCGYAPLMKYKGKFFAGWPSIPIWDPTTRSVRRVARNYNVLSSSTSSSYGSASRYGGLQSGMAATQRIPEKVLRFFEQRGATELLNPIWMADEPAHPERSHRLSWCSELSIIGRVLTYLYDPKNVRDILNFRLLHPFCNTAFENRQGTFLVQMICSTPVGVPVFSTPREHLSRIQYSFLHAGIPPLPFLLCRVFEIIGNLPAPYPFVAVPLVQQTFRVAPCLVPIFYRQHYFDGQLRLAVVLDLRDSLLKTMELRNGNLALSTIVGMGFEPMNKRQVMRHFILDNAVEEEEATAAGEWRWQKKCRKDGSPASSGADNAAAEDEDVLLRQSFISRRAFRPQAMVMATESTMGSMVSSPTMDTMPHMIHRDVEADIPLIHFRFLSRAAVDAGHYLRPEEVPRNWRDGNPLSHHSTVPAARADLTANLSPFPSDAVKAEPCGAVVPSCCCDDVPSDSADSSSSPLLHGRPWTLQHLLCWYNAFLTDTPHYRVFGCGDRSIAFSVPSLSMICTGCVAPGAVEGATAVFSPSKPPCFAPDAEHCTLHQKVREWLAV